MAADQGLSAAAKWSAACFTTIILRHGLVSGATFGRIAGAAAAAAA